MTEDEVELSLVCRGDVDALLVDCQVVLLVVVIVALYWSLG